MTESKIFIDGHRPRVYRSKLPFFDGLNWVAWCPCGFPWPVCRSSSQRYSYGILARHVKAKHL